jgi:hypothetical protein
VSINSTVRDSFEGLFSDIASGTKSAKELMNDFFKSIEQGISKIASQQLADKLFGGQGSGGVGGWFSNFLGLGKSSGGVGTPGSDSFVGPLQPSAGGGGVFDSIFKFFGSFFHKGGVVGRDGDQRPVSPFVFHTAKRLHEGGVPDAAAAAPGLKPNEVPAVLLREEEVLTRKDPRHRANIASAAKAGTLPELISKIASAFHGGGIAGVPTGTLRTIDPLALVSAQRFHTGGVAGFDQDELGRILDQSQSPKETLMREVQRKENRGRSQVNVTIVANDIGSFRRSQGQVQETIASAVDRGRRNQ